MLNPQRTPKLLKCFTMAFLCLREAVDTLRFSKMFIMHPLLNFAPDSATSSLLQLGMLLQALYMPVTEAGAHCDDENASFTKEDERA